jgi:protein-disulfide isomerase
MSDAKEPKASSPDASNGSHSSRSAGSTREHQSSGGDPAKAAPAQDGRQEHVDALVYVQLIAFSVALLTSILLLADYTRSSPVFCTGEGSGCGAIRATAFAYVGGIPTPLVGVLGMALLCFLRLRAQGQSSLAKLVKNIGSVALFAATALIAIQFVLRKICAYCMIVDMSTVVGGAALLAEFQRPLGLQPLSPSSRLRAGGLIILAASLVATIGWSKEAEVVVKAGPVPPVVQAMLDEEPNKLVIVDFTDFECPHCRSTHAELLPILEEYKDRVVLKRVHVPLRIHPHAEPAARAALCVEELDRTKGEEFANKLYGIPAADLVEFGFQASVRSLGLDEAKFRTCFHGDSVQARLKADRKRYEDAQVQGLPMIYFGAIPAFGAQNRGELRSKLKAALQGQGDRARAGKDGK